MLVLVLLVFINTSSIVGHKEREFDFKMEGTRRHHAFIRAVLPCMPVGDLHDVICAIFCSFGENLVVSIRACIVTIVTNTPKDFMDVLSSAKSTQKGNVTKGYEKHRISVLFRERVETNIQTVNDYHAESVTKLLMKKLKGGPVRYLSVKYDRLTKWLREIQAKGETVVDLSDYRTTDKETTSKTKALQPRAVQLLDEKRQVNVEIVQYPFYGQNYDKPDSTTGRIYDVNQDEVTEPHLHPRSCASDVKNPIQISADSIAQDGASLIQTGPTIDSASRALWTQQQRQFRVSYALQSIHGGLGGQHALQNENAPYRSEPASVQSATSSRLDCPEISTRISRGQFKHPIYEEESTRSASFVYWPSHNSQTPENLAAKGFFFTGIADLVRCFCCGLGLKGWQEDDDPVEEHRKHNADCTFLNWILNSPAYKDSQNQPKKNITNDTAKTGESNIYRQETQSFCFSPRHPNFVSLAVRISSFSKWPKSLTHPPQDLAKAGFFYTGIEDIVRCFACDGGMRHWDPKDEPWFEHAKHFPNCSYVLEQKGAEFAKNVRRQAEEKQNSKQSTRPQTSISTDVQRLSEAVQQISVQDNAKCSTENANEESIMKSDEVKTILDMGYTQEEVAAVLKKVGKGKITAQVIIDALLNREDRNQTSSVESSGSTHLWINPNVDDAESLVSENRRLRSLVKCVLCKKNERNVLALPCTHHKMCTQCAQGRANCPECGQHIKQKIRTYMS